MRPSFEPQSVVYQFPVSQILGPQLYTSFLCCTHFDRDAPFQRDTCDRFMCKGSDRRQRFFSFLFVFVSVARQWNCLEPLLEASHPNFDPDSSRGVIVRNTSRCLHLQHTTSGGGIGVLWWTAVAGIRDK